MAATTSRSLVGEARPAALRGERGDAGTHLGPDLDDAAGDGGVEPSAADEQPRQQVQTRGPAEVADRGRTAVAHLDQPGLRDPLQRLPDGGPGDAEHLRQPALAGQRLAGGESRRRGRRRAPGRRPGRPRSGGSRVAEPCRGR
ncbi:hypothetical protein [Nocardioides convexus]|uniref:hypothetical protein n=1 Tax=Nocardioides convexus TaxID=2712224 RepID=UPI0024184A38|nr:hypothetical protein [Nocardioides convexus]